jgi:putative peptidoglycan lipid II flippase
MVNRILQFLHKEVSNIHRAAYLLGFFALCSQVLALVRDKLLAYTFGAGTELDLYYAAFRVPDFLFVTIGSLVSLSVLIPFLVAEYEKGEERARSSIDSIFTFFLITIIFAGSLVFLLAPFLSKHLFPGFDTESLTTVTKLMRVLLLSPVLLGISNLFGSLTQSKNRFYVYAISPLLYNFGIILGTVFLYPRLGIVGLVWGVVIGAALHLLIQIPTVIHLGIAPRLTFKPKFSFIKQVTLLSFPRTITLSIANIAIFFILSLASFMTAGSISIFTFAFNLQSVPLSIFGVSYSMAAFPALSRLSASGDKAGFLSQFLTSAQHVLFWTVPSAVLFIVLRAHIVRIVLGAGRFNWTDTRLVAATLAIFSMSLVLQSLVLLMVRGLYAQGSTGKPFYVTIVSGGAMVLFSNLLVHVFNTVPTFRFFMEDLLKIPEISGTSVTMLALGFTLGSIFEGIFVWILFARTCKGFTKPLLVSLFRTFSASIIMGFVTFLGLRFFNQFFTLDTFKGVFFQAVCSSIVGVGVGLGVLTLLKSPELTQISQTLKQKIWRTQVVSPDSELV